MATLTERVREAKVANERQREADIAANKQAAKRKAIPYLNKFFGIEFTNEMLRAEPLGQFDETPPVFFEVEDWEFVWQENFDLSFNHYKPTLRVKVSGKDSWRGINRLSDLANVPKTIDQRSTRISRLFGRRAKHKS